MAVLQKNDGEQTPELEPYFDGALSEQCNQYHECADFEPYLLAGKPVLNAEYHSPRPFCAADKRPGSWARASTSPSTGAARTLLVARQRRTARRCAGLALA